MNTVAYPSSWPAEDGGAQRLQVSPTGVEPRIEGTPIVTTRDLLVGTMVVTREPGEVFLLCHSGGDDAVSWVEQIDPDTLAPLARSRDLPAGPTWPGGLAVHANGFLYVVFGRFAHKLSPALDVVASCELPRDLPYNSFVILGDGSLATKNFGGARPGYETSHLEADTELVILHPDDLRIVASAILPEASIARLSAVDNEIFVVGVESLWTLTWDPSVQELLVDAARAVAYRRDGEGYGWDPVITESDVWFLNNGQGSERFDGSLAGHGTATVPQCLVRVSRLDGSVTRLEVTSAPGGLVANPPAIDPNRHIAVGYDSGNRVVTAWSYESEPRVLWTTSLGHGSHPLVLPEQGLVVLGDFVEMGRNEDVVILDLASGDERCRVMSGSPIQSVLFPAVGDDNSIYIVSFLALTKVTWAA